MELPLMSNVNFYFSLVSMQKYNICFYFPKKSLIFLFYMEISLGKGMIAPFNSWHPFLFHVSVILLLVRALCRISVSEKTKVMIE